jgi:hypothetical protein
VSFLSLTLLCSAAFGQEPSATGDLSRAATDPTASLMALNFIGTYVGDYRDDQPGSDDDSTELSFRPVIPFKAFGKSNIMRLTIPYNAGGRGTHGLSTISVFDLIVQEKSWGRLGYGAVATLAHDGDAPDDFAIGPAVGGVWNLSGKLNVGVFNQNVFGGDTSISQFQPIIAYQLGNGWAVSAGDLQWVYDWRAGEWLSQPLGAQIGKVTRIGGQPIRWAVNPQFDLVDDPGTARWSVAFTFALLVP